MALILVTTILMSRLVSNAHKIFVVLQVILHYCFFTFFKNCMLGQVRPRQTTLKYSVFSKKLRCDFKKALALFLICGDSPAQNSSIHSMFALCRVLVLHLLLHRPVILTKTLSSLNFRIVNIYLKGMENL